MRVQETSVKEQLVAFLQILKAAEFTTDSDIEHLNVGLETETGGVKINGYCS